MKFIKLTAIDGSYHYFNTTAITHIFCRIKGETSVGYCGGYMLVKESPQEIINLINE